MSEKSITRQQAGLIRRAKTSRRNPAGLAGACSGGKFVSSSLCRGQEELIMRESKVQSEIPV